MNNVLSSKLIVIVTVLTLCLRSSQILGSPAATFNGMMSYDVKSTDLISSIPSEQPESTENGEDVGKLRCKCTSEYAPVCGSDGKTYQNSCALLCQSMVQPGLKERCKGKCPCRCMGVCLMSND